MAHDGTTMQDEGVPGFETPRPIGDTLALVVAWCPDEPWRLGEVFLFPSLPRPYVLGRGDTPLEGHERVLPVRQRPGGSRPSSPVGIPRLSRHQLVVEVGRRTLHVRSVGQSRLLHEGLPVDEAEVRPGEALQVGSALLLLCTTRPWRIGPEGAKATHPFGDADEQGIVGESPVAWALRATIDHASAQEAHVLVEGPSGAGKELVARAIHRGSRRGHRQMVSRNAATFPETLIDAELFGNAANYPNAGMPARPGLVGQADRSTLFLDEIGELNDSAQAHLLRVLDDGEYQRLGESTMRRADFRFIGATRRSVDHLRHDLLARMRVRVTVPGLGLRRDDIPLIARHLLRQIGITEPSVVERFFEGGPTHGHARMSPALVRLLVQHDYTMHVRELEAMLRQAAADSPGNFLDVSPGLLRDEGDQPAPSEPVDPSDLPPEVIQECLDRHDGVQAKVWKELGLSSRHALARLIKKYGLRVGPE